MIRGYVEDCNAAAKHAMFEFLAVADLLSTVIPSAGRIVEGPMQQGTLLVGGKSKCCKSWLMLELALAASAHPPVWNQFAVSEPLSFCTWPRRTVRTLSRTKAGSP